MALLDDVKAALRVDGQEHDGEIGDLIAAAKADLQLAGVNPAKVADEADPLIKRAIVTYVKLHFDWDAPGAERIQRAYDLLKAHLSIAGDYAAPPPSEEA